MLRVPCYVLTVDVLSSDAYKLPVVPTLPEVFARNLRALREQRELTQEQLAELAGMHRTFVGAVERGDRNASLRTVQRLATALDVEPHRLLDPDALTA